jgi:glutathione reductase (NADPH)
MAEEYDLFVIGAGSGGVRASRLAAAAGARVALAEEIRVGGTCVLRGCVPKKLLVIGSHYRDDFEDAAAYGWRIPAEPQLDWPSLIRAKNAELDRLHGIYLQRVTQAGVEVIDGRATLEGPHAVRVGKRVLAAKRILVAVGGWPTLPQIPGIEHAITSNEALDLPELPRRIGIVGSGYIAVEFAGIFAALGVAVTQIFRADKPLRGFDEDVRGFLGEEIAKKGVALMAGRQVRAIAKRDDGALDLALDDGGAATVDAALYATGRAPNTRNLRLEQAGVKLAENGAVIVDDFSQSSVPSIHAIGDVTDRVNLTPVAIAEAHCLVDTLFHGKRRGLSYENIPSAVFSQPPVSVVGLSEAEAKRRFGEVDIYASRFRPLKHTITGRDERTLMKLVVKRSDQKVVGAHMVGADAPEIIQGLAIAVTCGATKQDFDRTIGIHPTAAEEFVTLRDKRPD